MQLEIAQSAPRASDAGSGHMANTKEHDSSRWAFGTPPEEAVFT
jgi:hypothetical protein